MGGGALMTPILIFLFNFNPAAAIGTDILHGAIFKSFAAFGTVAGDGEGSPGGLDAAGERAGLAARRLVRDLSHRPLRRQRRLRQGQVLGYTLLFGSLAFVAKG